MQTIWDASRELRHLSKTQPDIVTAKHCGLLKLPVLQLLLGRVSLCVIVEHRCKSEKMEFMYYSEGPTAGLDIYFDL